MLAEPQAPRLTTRLDKWLWQARFFKTRSLATREVQAGHVRVNAARVTKAATLIGAGDTLTFAAGDRVRLIQVEVIGERRGPAAEAQLLYMDMDPQPVASSLPYHSLAGPAPGFDGSGHRGGRPTKKDRRTYDLSRRPPLE